MIITLNKGTLNGNIDNDILNIGSDAGDVILAQQKANVDKFDIKEFDELPQCDELIGKEELESRKTKSKVHRVFVFDKIAVNGIQIDCQKKFLIFIRESFGQIHKMVIGIQANRVFPEYDVDNKEVLRCISKHIGNEGYIVDALEYDEENGVLNFIIYLYGNNAKASHVYRDYALQHRKLKNYDNKHVASWNDVEFSIQCIQLIRKYELKNKIDLLLNKRYCKMRFDMTYKNASNEKEMFSFLSTNHIENNTYMEQPIELFGEKYYLATRWANESKKLMFWNWLLDNIAQVSNDVVIDYSENEVKFLKVPNEIPVDVDAKILELGYKVETGTEKKNFKPFFLEQHTIVGDEVLLVDEEINRLRAYCLYRVKFFKEQSLLLDKQKDMVDFAKEQEVLRIARKELLNNE